MPLDAWAPGCLGAGLRGRPSVWVLGRLNAGGLAVWASVRLGAWARGCLGACGCLGAWADQTQKEVVFSFVSPPVSYYIEFDVRRLCELYRMDQPSRG